MDSHLWGFKVSKKELWWEKKQCIVELRGLHSSTIFFYLSESQFHLQKANDDAYPRVSYLIKHNSVYNTTKNSVWQLVDVQ